MAFRVTQPLLGIGQLCLAPSQLFAGSPPVSATFTESLSGLQLFPLQSFNGETVLLSLIPMVVFPCLTVATFYSFVDELFKPVLCHMDVRPRERKYEVEGYLRAFHTCVHFVNIFILKTCELGARLTHIFKYTCSQGTNTRYVSSAIILSTRSEGLAYTSSND